MQVGYNDAVAVFERISGDRKTPSLHPYYILTDSSREQELRPVFFIYEEENKFYYHGFHLGNVRGTEYHDIQSSYGYGGPVSSSDDRTFLARAWTSFEIWCRDENVLAEFIRFHPLLENWRFYNGEVVYDRPTVWLDLTHKDLLSTYSTRSRTAVRKAMKNSVRVEWQTGEAYAEAFTTLYHASLSKLQADKFYYFNADYISRILNWHQTHLALCFLNKEIVAAGLFLADQFVIEYHLSASSETGRNFSATNLMLHEAALLGQRMGCRALHLGGGNSNQPSDPLFFFKTGYSSEQGLFKIGKRIYKSDAYEALRSDWLKKHNVVSDRILFYRF